MNSLIPQCPACGRSLIDNGRFCSGCGHQLLPQIPLPQPTFGRNASVLTEKEVRKSSLLKRLCIVIGAVWLGYFALNFFSSFATSFKDSYRKSYNQARTGRSEAKPVEAKVSPQKQTPNVRLYRPGQTIHVGYWSYKVGKTFWSPVVGDFRAQPDSGQYLVVELILRNDDQTESTRPSLKLVNAKGQVFSESSAGSYSQGFLSPLKSLNPTVESTGLVAFDVPQGIYNLKLSGGYESTAAALVKLRMPNEQNTGDQEAQASDPDVVTEAKQDDSTP